MASQSDEEDFCAAPPQEDDLDTGQRIWLTIFLHLMDRTDLSADDAADVADMATPRCLQAREWTIDVDAPGIAELEELVELAGESDDNATGEDV